MSTNIKINATELISSMSNIADAFNKINERIKTNNANSINNDKK